jgi:hypothetical protein
MTDPSTPSSTAAPADARPHAPWPRPRKIAAYIILLAVALISVWFINRRVDALADRPAPAPHAQP